MNNTGVTVRIIPCLDCRDGRVVKGIQFQGLQDAGDPACLAKRYEEEGADELVLLDISATLEARRHQLETVKRVRSMLSIPLTAGGGVRSVSDVEALLEAGADKVSVNTAAVQDPGLLSQIAETFGRQCTVLALDAAQSTKQSWSVFVRSGTEAVERLDALSWAKEATSLGAGEILLTSRDRDGTKSGYDLNLLQCIAHNVAIPVIASGGARTAADFVAAANTGATGLLAASIFHYSECSILDIKKTLKEKAVRVRL